MRNLVSVVKVLYRILNSAVAPAADISEHLGRNTGTPLPVFESQVVINSIKRLLQ